METVALNPVPGFCVKSRATNDALVRLTASDQPRAVEKGLKIFINVAWDSNIPPPPPASEDAVQRAMQCLDSDGSDSADGAWFVPIVLSDARQDTDKAGHSAIVFDCVLNPSVKSRCLRNPDFKNFIIELALQRIETQTHLALSRQIGTPNIPSKGKPQSRRVHVPTALFPPGHLSRQAPATFVHEIPLADRSVGVPDVASPKGIIKQPLAPKPDPQIPTWFCAHQGLGIRIVFAVPGVTHAIIPECTLDVEPRRVLLHVPALYDLDINLDSPDSELISVFAKNETADEALKLKRMRSLNVDEARAEWRVADRTIILLA